MKDKRKPAGEHPTGLTITQQEDTILASFSPCATHARWQRECAHCWDAHQQTINPITSITVEIDQPDPYSPEEHRQWIIDSITSSSSEPPEDRQYWTDPTQLFSQPEPPTACFTRSDGQPIVYDGLLSWLYGEPGVGKSFLTLMAVHQALERDMRVAYVDYEDYPSTFGERAKMIGGQTLVAQLMDDQDRFRYIPGHGFTMEDRIDLACWVGGGLVVIDSAGAAGCPSHENNIGDWMGEHISPWVNLPDAYRPAVLVVDHVPKARVGRPPGPIGSQNKRQAVRGIALKAWGNCWTRNEPGAIHLVCEKDRVGHWKQDQPVATISGNWTDNTFGYRIGEPKDQPNGHGQPLDIDQVKDTICDLIVANLPEGLTYTPLRDQTREHHPISNKLFASVLRTLVGEGVIVKRKVGRYDHYQLPLKTL